MRRSPWVRRLCVVATIMIHASETGIRIFQPSAMNWS